MRRRLTLLVLSLLAVGGAVARGAEPAATSVPPATELLSNGDFSRATKNPAWPDDWKQRPWIKWESAKDSRYLRFAASEPGKTFDVAREIFLPATPAVEAIRVTVRYRTHDVKVGAKPGQDARLSFAFFDAVRIRFEPPPDPIIFSPAASAWTTATATLRVPDHAVSLVVTLGLEQVDAGTLDIARISLEPVSAAGLPPAATATTAAPGLPVRREGDATIIGDGKPSVWFIHPYVDVVGHDFDMGINHLIADVQAHGRRLTIGVAPRLEPANEQDEAHTSYVFSYKNINYPLPADAERLVFLNTWLLPAVEWPAARAGHRDFVLLGSKTLHNNGDGLAINKDRWMQIQKSDPSLTVRVLDSTGYYLPMGVWRGALFKILTDQP